MAQFIEVDPESVIEGNERKRMIALYVVGIEDSEAGYVLLEEDEPFPSARRYLRAAAKQLGMKIRILPYDAEFRRLTWKMVRAVGAKQENRDATTD